MPQPKQTPQTSVDTAANLLAQALVYEAAALRREDPASPAARDLEAQAQRTRTQATVIRELRRVRGAGRNG